MANIVEFPKQKKRRKAYTHELQNKIAESFVESQFFAGTPFDAAPAWNDEMAHLDYDDKEDIR